MRFILLILLPGLLYAQELRFELQPEAFPVEIAGWQAYSPWSGGLQESNPDLADLDADGDLDFIVGSSTFFTYFTNMGTANSPDYVYASEIMGGLVTEGWTAPELCDTDNDGDFDLFATSDERVWYWENVGTPQQPQWQFVTDSLEQITWWAINLNFVDIDADGDFDLFAGGGGPITFYRNQGSPEVLNLVLESMSFAGINVGAHADPTFIDIDADNDLDLFIGERYGKIWYYRNDGDSANFNFTYVSKYYDSIDVGDYSSPEFADIDGDGDYDLFVGREPVAGSLMGDIFFYENVGTAANAQFELVTANYLTADLGPYVNNPQIVDLNGDGVPDLAAGVTSSLDYFVNTGDSLSPSYSFVEEGFQSISRSAIKPFFVDIDADGDLDLFAGEGVIPGPPTVALYLNRGSSQIPQLELYDANFITNSNFWVNANPGLADIDADGDYDLFITDDHGHFFYYQNNGTPQWPDFVFLDSQWQGIQFYYPNYGWRGFSFGDLDEDGDLDLLMSNLLDTNLRFYRNTGTPQSPSMSFETDSLLSGQNIYSACPCLVDIDLDNDLDLFVGDGYGGIMFFRNTTGDTSAVSPPPVYRHPQAGLQISLGPNPANPFVAASFELRAASQISLEIFDISGRKLVELASGFHLPGEYRYVWDASSRAAGIYFVRLRAGEEWVIEKVVLLK